MKKSSKILLLVITIMSIFMVMTISSSALTSGDYTYSVSDGNATITDYTGSATNLEIPSTIDDYTVTSIGNYAFADCTSLQSITIGDSVTTIDEGAFAWCDSIQNMYYTGTADDWAKITFCGWSSNPMEYADYEYFNGELVTDVVLSEGITSINDYAFYSCDSLRSITIPDSVTSIGYEAFSGCTKLQCVTIGNSVTSIGDYAYYNCISLQSITIPDGVTTIGEKAFYYCRGLQSITIPDSVTSIGNYAFAWCDSLQNMYYTGTADDWAKIVFSSSSSNPMYYAKNEYFDGVLVKDVVLSEGITSLNYTFYGCYSLQSITIPDSVTSIGDYAFSYCGSLQSITIPDSVTSIDEYAFEYCYSLQSITIPDSVTSIGSNAFNRCYNLWHVLYKGADSQWNEISIGDCNSYLISATLHCKVKNNIIVETITKEPTCTENGEKDLSCSICDAKKTNVTAYKLGHDLHFIETVETSCQKYGYDAYTCSRCDYIEERNCVEMVEHNFKNGTCTYCGGLETDCVSSPHNYPNNYDNTWIISKPDATKIKVTFSEKTYTEEYIDFIYIYDANDNLVGKYSGNQLAGACITVNSDKVKIRLTSDDSENYYGFSVKKVDVTYIPTDYTGLYKVNGVWRYVKNGELDNSFTGLVKYSGKWYHVKDGVKTTYTGLVKHSDGKYYYVKNGVKTSFNGLVKYNSKWYHVKDGVKTTYTGLVKHTDGKYYYVKSGVKTSFNGLVKYNGKWYYVKSGVVDKTYTGLVKHTDGKWYYVKSGVKTSFNGLVKYNGKWYYVKSGVVNTNYTGLVKHTDGKWYYVKKGVKTTYTGNVKYNGKTYKVVKGVKV